MAQIRRVSWAHDLFGEEARGMTFPTIAISWGDYDTVVELVAEKHGRDLRRVTPKLIRRAAAGTIHVVPKTTQQLTLVVTEIAGADVSFVLNFDGFAMYAAAAVQQVVFNKIKDLARLSGLVVKDAGLCGTIRMPRPINVFMRAETFAKNTREPWPHPDNELSAELAWLSSRRQTG